MPLSPRRRSPSPLVIHTELPLDASLTISAFGPARPHSVTRTRPAPQTRGAARSVMSCATCTSYTSPRNFLGGSGSASAPLSQRGDAPPALHTDPRGQTAQNRCCGPPANAVLLPRGQTRVDAKQRLPDHTSRKVLLPWRWLGWAACWLMCILAAAGAWNGATLQLHWASACCCASGAHRTTFRLKSPSSTQCVILSPKRILPIAKSSKPQTPHPSPSPSPPSPKPQTPRSQP